MQIKIKKITLIQIFLVFGFMPSCESDEKPFKVIGKAEAFISFELQEQDLPTHLSGGARVFDGGAIEYWSMLIDDDVEVEVRGALVKALTKLTEKSGLEIKKAQQPLLKGEGAKWLVELTSKKSNKKWGTISYFYFTNPESEKGTILVQISEKMD